MLKHRTHSEYDAVDFGKVGLNHTLVAQPFRARALKKLQIVAVIHHATGVGIFPINLHRPNEPGLVDGWNGCFQE